MELIIFLLLTLLITFLLLTIISWTVHLQMLHDKYSKATYSQFIECFSKVKWVQKSGFTNSLFDENWYNECHASIYRFGGVCMKFGYFDYLKVIWFMYWELKKYQTEDYQRNHTWTID